MNETTQATNPWESDAARAEAGPSIFHDGEETEAPDVWQLLESPPKGMDDIADLYSWSLNYDAGKGPFVLFLDLIGWSEENIGDALYPSLANAQGLLGYVELSKLGDALKVYADNPHGTRAFVDQLMEAEGR